jgi:hypothetical protein
VAAGYSEFVMEDFYEAFMDEVKLCVEGQQSEAVREWFVWWIFAHASTIGLLCLGVLVPCLCP